MERKEGHLVEATTEKIATEVAGYLSVCEESCFPWLNALTNRRSQFRGQTE